MKDEQIYHRSASVLMSFVVFKVRVKTHFLSKQRTLQNHIVIVVSTQLPRRHLPSILRRLVYCQHIRLGLVQQEIHQISFPPGDERATSRMIRACCDNVNSGTIGLSGPLRRFGRQRILSPFRDSYLKTLIVKIILTGDSTELQVNLITHGWPAAFFRDSSAITPPIGISQKSGRANERFLFSIVMAPIESSM